MSIFASDRPRFDDRRAAGRVLAGHLESYRGKQALVLGIPRGGVPVAEEVAWRIDGELDVIVARKLGSPLSPELAIGAVTAHGGRVLNRELIVELDVDEAYLERATKQEVAEALRRERLFRGSDSPAQARDRIVVVVDDGLATAATMQAAVDWVRTQGPAELVVAVPVGAEPAVASLGSRVDRLVCPYVPDPFYAVGQFYSDYATVTDQDVVEILGRWRRGPAGTRPSAT